MPAFFYCSFPLTSKLYETKHRNSTLRTSTLPKTHTTTTSVSHHSTSALTLACMFGGYLPCHDEQAQRAIACVRVTPLKDNFLVLRYINNSE